MRRNPLIPAGLMTVFCLLFLGLQIAWGAGPGTSVVGVSSTMVISALGLICLTMAGWLFLILFNAIKTIRDNHDSLHEKVDKHTSRIGAIEVNIPSHYVSKSDLDRRWQELLDRLDRFEKKLDEKPNREAK